MTKRVQIIGHTTAAADAFTGSIRELSVDTTRKEARVHDGATAGGIPLLRRDLDNVVSATLKTKGLAADLLSDDLSNLNKDANLKIAVTETVINEDGGLVDFRAETDAVTNAFLVDASADKVEIHVNLDVYGDVQQETGKTAATAFAKNVFSADGDGTDDVFYKLFGVGTLGSVTNVEYMHIGYEATGTQFEISSQADGTGTLRPVVLYTEGNADQLKLNIDGSVSMSAALAITGALTGVTTLAISGLATLDSLTVTNATTLSGTVAFGDVVSGADNEVNRVKLKDYSETTVAKGNLGATPAFDLEAGNVQTGTNSENITSSTMTNWPATGIAGSLTLIITNGGAFTFTWPTSVDWPGGTAPTLTTAGVDILVFTSIDAGTIVHGMLASADSK